MITVRRLVWNDWNVAHIARHQVTPGEVEEVFRGKYVVRPSYKNRYAVTGPTSSKRILTVVVEPTERTGQFFPITARPASRQERREYQPGMEVKMREQKQ